MLVEKPRFNIYDKLIQLQNKQKKPTFIKVLYKSQLTNHQIQDDGVEIHVLSIVSLGRSIWILGKISIPNTEI